MYPQGCGCSLPISERTSGAGGPVLASGEQARSSETQDLLLTTYSLTCLSVSSWAQITFLNKDCFFSLLREVAAHVLTLQKSCALTAFNVGKCPRCLPNGLSSKFPFCQPIPIAVSFLKMSISLGNLLWCWGCLGF